MHVERGQRHFFQYLLIFGLFCITFISSFYVYAAQDLPKKETNLHGSPWAFGQSDDREALIWKKGVDGAKFSKKTDTDKNKLKSADTRSSIDQALSNANKNTPHGNFNLSMQKESSTWAVSPEQKSIRPDEDKAREQRHVLGAYAGVETGNDLKISIGPELIIKDEKHSTESANSDQPDSAFGMGMKFKYDF